MKILMLTPYLPYPLYSGGQIRSYNLIKNLSQRHQITLFSFIRSAEEKQYVKYLQPFCSKVSVFKRRPAWDLRNLILALFSPYPFLVAIYLSKTIQTAILKELKTQAYDLIHAETFYVMPNLPRATQVPTLLVEQTIEYLVYQRFVEDFKLFFLKPLLYFDVFKIKRWEKFYWQQATRLAAMSSADKKIMQQEVPQRSKIDVVANGVDAGFFSQVARRPTLQPSVLFVGNFKWLPNKDAAEFLAKKIWPLVLKKLPQAQLVIVGRNPTAKTLVLAKLPNVTVKGNVVDVRTELARAWALLAPIRNGRGTKYKVLEAMASGLPVITTKLGIEGIEAKQSVLVAETASALAQNTLAFLTRPDLAKQLSDKAKKIVYRQYNWRTISDRLDTIYQQLGGA